MRPPPIPTALLFALLVSACSSEGEGPEAKANDAAPSAPRAIPEAPPFDASALAGIRNATAKGDVVLAGQPTPEQFELAAAAGVQSVVTLRTEGEVTDFDEPALVESLGMQFIPLRFSPDTLDDATFDTGRELLGEAERPLLLHCGSANRVGALWIPWRVLDGGMELEAAVAEAKAIGLRTPLLEEKARAYVTRHAGD